jgi:hypothetical protein
MVCEDRFNGVRLGHVIVTETHAMGVDVVDAVLRKSRLVEGGLDDARHAGATEVASGKLLPIPHGGVPQDLRIYPGIPFRRLL